ncbi:MAG: CarD family transcriptional regulator [Actinomycetia bacterium]|nr:CarD family transcriptional regulator [Actinomycetes bacterium]
MAQRTPSNRKPARARVKPRQASGRKRKSKSPPRYARGAAGSAAVAPREPKYKKGDYVVHIQHGVAHISDIQVKSDFGEEQEYFVLNFPTEEMVISVPTNKTLYTIRPLIDKTEAGRVVQMLKEDPQESGANWSRWYKVLQEKMYSGDIFQVAEVVRDLNYSNQTKGISPALKKMLNRARSALITEIRFSLGLEAEAAETKINRALPTFEPISRKK